MPRSQGRHLVISHSLHWATCKGREWSIPVSESQPFGLMGPLPQALRKAPPTKRSWTKCLESLVHVCWLWQGSCPRNKTRMAPLGLVCWQGFLLCLAPAPITLPGFPLPGPSLLGGGSVSCCCLSLGALPTLFGSYDSAHMSIEPLHCVHFSETLLSGHLNSAGLMPRVHGPGGRQAHLELRRAKVPAIWIWWGISTHYIITSSPASNHNLTHAGFLCLYG